MLPWDFFTTISCLLKDPDCVAKVKQLYDELRLPELYHDYKKNNRNTVMHLIDQFFHSDENLRNACINLFSQGYDWYIWK